MPFCQPTTATSNTCIMVLLKLTFVLLCVLFLSPLRHICDMHVMASVQDLGKRSTIRGASYIILYLECYPKCPKCSKKLETKCSNTPWLSDTPTNLIDKKYNLWLYIFSTQYAMFVKNDNWGACLNNQMRNDWIDCRDTFYAALRFYCCVIGWKSVNTKRTDNWIFTN